MMATDMGAVRLRWRLPGPVQHAVVDDTQVHALTVSADGGYEMIVVVRDTGTVTARLPCDCFDRRVASTG